MINMICLKRDTDVCLHIAPVAGACKCGAMAMAAAACKAAVGRKPAGSSTPSSRCTDEYTFAASSTSQVDPKKNVVLGADQILIRTARITSIGTEHPRRELSGRWVPGPPGVGGSAAPAGAGVVTGLVEVGAAGEAPGVMEAPPPMGAAPPRSPVAGLWRGASPFCAASPTGPEAEPPSLDATEPEDPLSEPSRGAGLF